MSASFVVVAYVFTTLLSAIAAILAWTAKLRWSREYGAAKDEIIKAKEAQMEMLKSNYAAVKDAKDAHIEQLKSEIRSLQDQSPVKLKEYFMCIKNESEEAITDLQNKLADARTKIAEKDWSIEKLTQDSGLSEERMQILLLEKAQFESKAAMLESELKSFIRNDEILSALAATDLLTNLPNRAALISKARELDAEGKSYSLAVIDLDNFKEVNDQYGHEEGDKLLKSVAEILTGFVGENSFVARLGGDEFVVLFISDSEEEALKALHALIDALPKESQLTAKYQVSASIGLSSCHCQTFDSKMKEADYAMFEAKGQGRKRVNVYGPGTEMRFNNAKPQA